MGTNPGSPEWWAGVDDVRWFASNPYTTLVVPELRRSGLRIALEGNSPARVALAMSGRVAEPAWRYAQATRASLVLYLWDLPPKGTAIGKADPIWWIGGRFLRLPRMVGGYQQRAGYYSRLRFITSRADQLWTASEFTAGLVQERFGVSGTPCPIATTRSGSDSAPARAIPAGPAHRFAARDPQESGSGAARGCLAR